MGLRSGKGWCFVGVWTVLAGMLSATSSVSGATVTFGSGASQTTIDFVPIGNPGNPGDPTGKPVGAGSVGYTYSIAKYELSAANLLAYNAAMAGSGLEIGFINRGAQRPATGIAWNEAARFANWLNSDQGYAPAYKFTSQEFGSVTNMEMWSPTDTLDYDPNNPFRSKRARYVLPSVDEWYKASYYDPNANGGVGGYWDFPTGSDTSPTNVGSGTLPNTIVMVQPFFNGPAAVDQAGGLSPYGVMGLGGNVQEWNETQWHALTDSWPSNPNISASAQRVRRGGPWHGDNNTQARSVQYSFSFPNANGIDDLGFRVVQLNDPTAPVPEPGSLAVMSLLALGGLGRRMRARKR
jgi:formylglycine-generating enzyme required for sulfatase activity